MLIGIAGKAGSGKDLTTMMLRGLQVAKSSEIENPDLDWIEKFYVNSIFENKKFADTLKDMVCVLLKCTREQLEDEEFKNTELGEEWNIYHLPGQQISLTPFTVCGTESFRRGVTPRFILQTLGTEWGRRMIHPNVWVNSLFRSYNQKSEWIISDVRFKNEAKDIKDRGGILIRVNRLVGKLVVVKYSGIIPWAGVVTKYVGCNNYEVCSVDSKIYTLSKRDIFPVEDHESETGLDNYNEFDFVIENEGTKEELLEQVKEISNHILY